MAINNIISKIYYDKSGFGSIKTTFEDAKKVDKSITLEDVKTFLIIMFQRKII